MVWSVDASSPTFFSSSSVGFSLELFFSGNLLVCFLSCPFLNCVHRVTYPNIHIERNSFISLSLEPLQ
jgi:hypothetical protein